MNPKPITMAKTYSAKRNDQSICPTALLMMYFSEIETGGLNRNPHCLLIPRNKKGGKEVAKPISRQATSKLLLTIVLCLFFLDIQSSPSLQFFVLDNIIQHRRYATEDIHNQKPSARYILIPDHLTEPSPWTGSRGCGGGGRRSGWLIPHPIFGPHTLHEHFRHRQCW